eukprot:968630-Rhodomonas_salina.1
MHPASNPSQSIRCHGSLTRPKQAFGTGHAAAFAWRRRAVSHRDCRRQAIRGRHWSAWTRPQRRAEALSGPPAAQEEQLVSEPERGRERENTRERKRDTRERKREREG